MPTCGGRLWSPARRAGRCGRSGRGAWGDVWDRGPATREGLAWPSRPPPHPACAAPTRPKPPAGRSRRRRGSQRGRGEGDVMMKRAGAARGRPGHCPDNVVAKARVFLRDVSSQRGRERSPERPRVLASVEQSDSSPRCSVQKPRIARGRRRTAPGAHAHRRPPLVEPSSPASADRAARPGAGRQRKKEIANVQLGPGERPAVGVARGGSARRLHKYRKLGTEASRRRPRARAPQSRPSRPPRPGRPPSSATSSGSARAGTRGAPKAGHEGEQARVRRIAYHQEEGAAAPRGPAPRPPTRRGRLVRKRHRGGDGEARCDGLEAVHRRACRRRRGGGRGMRTQEPPPPPSGTGGPGASQGERRRWKPPRGPGGSRRIRRRGPQEDPQLAAPVAAGQGGPEGRAAPAPAPRGAHAHAGPQLNRGDLRLQLCSSAPSSSPLGAERRALEYGATPPRPPLPFAQPRMPVTGRRRPSARAVTQRVLGP